MPRRVVITLVVLCLIGGGLGLWAGWRVATLTETDVIEAAVADYLAAETALGHQAAETDCSATPGADDVWIVVLCLPLNDPDARRTEYYVSRFGSMSVFRGG